MTAPLGHLTERRRKHTLNGDEIAPNYNEAAAFEALKGRVRSGDVAVGRSRRYRAFEGYLLSAPHFEQIVQKDQTRLAVTEKAETYLATKQQEIIGKLEVLQESIGKVEGSLCLDDKGKLHLPALEKEIPAEVERLRLSVYDMLPQITLPGLLLELDNWTGFLRPLTHLTSGDAPNGTMGGNAACRFLDSSWNRLGLVAHAQTRSVSTPKSGSKSAHRVRETRTDLLFAGVFSRRSAASAHSHWDQ